jgi:hypothetical protein
MSPLSENELLRNEALAHVEYLLRSVPLIVFDDDSDGVWCASGTLFRRGPDFFLITASHVLEDMIKYPNAFAIATDPPGDGPREMWSLGSGTFHHALAEDVGVLRLETQAAVGRLRSGGYVFATDDDVSFEETELFLVFGWPAARIQPRQDPRNLDVMPIELVVPWSEAHPKKLDTDILLQWPTADVGELQGISGAPIWNCTPDCEGVIHPSKRLKLVGIQHSVLDGQYLRGTGWAVVNHLLETLPRR